MNVDKSNSRIFGPAIFVLWIAFLLLANYLSFWHASDFKSIVGADPVYTQHVVDVGWPVRFGTQNYSRQTPVPSIRFTATPRLLFWNLLICAASLFSVYVIAWRLKSITNVHLLGITTTVAIVLTVANASSANFGWNFWDCCLIYLFVSPVVFLSIQLPYHLVKLILKTMRPANRIAG